MATTETYTVREICTAALRKIGVTASDEAATAEDIETARGELSRMLKGWQNAGFNLWAVASQSLALTTAVSYSLNPVRPLEILTARYLNGGTEIPMQRLTREEYDVLPVKTTTGTPTTFYYDKQREAALFYVWPVLAAANGSTVEMTYTRELDDMASLDDTTDVPSEWFNCVIYNLADQLMDDFDVDRPRVSARAAAFLNDAMAFDREGSVNFYGYS